MRPARLLLIYWPLIALLMQIDSAVLDILLHFVMSNIAPEVSHRSSGALL